MKLQFIGATGTVTGAKYLLTADKKNYLVDCGLFQGLKTLRLRNWHPMPFDPKSVEAVVLTHAHIDHSGYLPLLVKNGFRGKIYATEGTRDLCRILLPDSGHLQEEDARYANKRGFSKHHPALPLYTEEDALASLSFFEAVPWGRKVALSKNLSFAFHPAGHILGAAWAELYAHGRSVVFSGDLGRQKNIVMPPPASPLRADYLVVESTYGNRLHPPDNPQETLKELINKTVGRGGIVLIPAFAVGRAQEILYLVSRLKKTKAIPDVPVYLNSPMAVKATRIFCDFVGEHALTPEECEDLCEAAQFVTDMEDSKRLNARRDPAIVISASGMATGGRVLHHLKALAPDPKNLILFAGFQAAGTRGEAMVHGAEAVKIHGEMVPVRAEVVSLETLSAHADADEILAWLKTFSGPPKMTFLTHGEPLAAEALRKRIEEELRWPCVIPDYLESFDLA
jgi:metallo-beta-lactamase family protein